MTTRLKKFDLTAALCLLGATLCWGVAPVMLEYLSREDRVPDGFTTNLIRYPVGTLLYVPLLVMVLRRTRLGRFWRAAIIPAVVNIIGQTLWAWSFYYISASAAAFLIRLCIIWGIIGAFALFPDERKLAKSGLFWGGTVLALGGFAMMSAQDAMAVRGAAVIGVVMMFFCSIFWGLYSISVRYVMGSLNPLVVFGIVGGYTSVGLAFMAPLGEPGSVVHLSGGDLTLLIVSALIGIGAAHGLYYVAVQRMGVAVSALTLTATPFVSAIVARVWLHEEFAPIQWIGGLVLAMGSGLALLSQQRLKHPPVPDPHEVGPE